MKSEGPLAIITTVIKAVDSLWIIGSICILNVEIGYYRHSNNDIIIIVIML
jgi:hypothetical protein